MAGRFYSPYRMNDRSFTDCLETPVTYHERVPGLTMLSIRKWRVATWLACLVISSAVSGADDEWFARAWRVDDGLPDNNVSGVVQAPDGYLWVATHGGLMRFDGVRFQEFPPDNLEGAPGRGVLAMVLDQRNRLWLALDRGIVACLESGTARLFTEADNLPPGQTITMCEDGEGAIWIYDVRGNLLRIKDGEVSRYGADEGFPRGVLCSLATDDQGRLWFARGRKVGVFRDGRFQTVLPLRSDNMSLGTASGGGVWICAGSRLLKCDESGQVVESGQLPPGVVPSVVFEDRAGAVWIGTTINGLFRYDASGIQSIPTSHGEIRCLTEDSEGNLWVGTGGGGLNRLRRRAVALLGADDGLPVQSLRSVSEDASDRLWVASQNGMLMRGRDGQWTVASDATNWPGGRAMCVAGVSSGAVWIGTDRGLLRWQDGLFETFGTERGLDSGFVRSLLVSSRGDVWVGLSRVLQRLRGTKFKTFELPGPVRTLRALAEDTEGNIWLGTSDGRLFRVSEETVVDETVRLQGGAHSIRCLHATPDGSVWIGYAGNGLGRVKEGKYFRIGREHGLADDYISQIVADPDGRLWLAGNHGIFQLSLAEIENLAEGRASRVRPIRYGQGEGVPNLQATCENDPGVWKGRNGHLWITTRTGLAVIRPENVPANPEPPPVRLERVAVDGRTVGLYASRFPLRPAGLEGVRELGGPASDLRLNPDPRRIEFEFTALSFTAPENVLFRYRLEGFDEDWSDAGTERGARYPRLPAGSYRFHVTACNNAGVWNESGAALSFIVLPFFWETWWFRLAVFAGFTMSVIAIVRYVSFRRLRWQLRVLEQQAALDKERTRIARDLHDDLGGSLTETALLLDMSQKESGSPAEMGQRLLQCSNLVRQVVKSVDEIIWAINPRNDTLRYLVDYISQFAVEFLHAARLRCRVDLPDDYPERQVSPEVRHNLFLIVKESLNNIAQHAQASEVWLRVKVGADEMIVTVEDNGRGFEQVPDNSRSDGLRNMRQRMEEIGGRLDLDSEPGSGTRISLVYPWPPEK